jgi:hypothetical protein
MGGGGVEWGLEGGASPPQDLETPPATKGSAHSKCLDTLSNPSITSIAWKFGRTEGKIDQTNA